MCSRKLQIVLNAAARTVVGSLSANTSTLHRCFVTLFTGCQSLRGYSSRSLLWPSTVSEVWSCLPQASLGFVTSVTLFGWPRWLVRFAGKHVHRPTKFLHRGSCRLERTSTWPPLTTHQSPAVPIEAEDSPFPTSLQHCMTPLRTIVEECNCNCNCMCVICRLLSVENQWKCLRYICWWSCLFWLKFLLQFLPKAPEEYSQVVIIFLIQEQLGVRESAF